MAGQPVGAMLNDFGRGPRAAGYGEIAVAHASMATPVPEGVDLAHIAAVLATDSSIGEVPVRTTFAHRPGGDRGRTCSCRGPADGLGA